MENKKEKLEEIKKEIENCAECKLGKTGIAVPGEGNPDAKVMFIGEAPGRNESLTGRPFIGRSGKFLREQINAIGLTEEEVFITSPVKYLPTYKTPNERDIIHGMTHLKKQIEIIDPKVLVLLGRVAVLGVLGEKFATGENHGRVITREGRNYFISYHPAAAIRFFKFRGVFIADFQILKTFISS